MYEQIPQELKALPNWICWDAVPDEKRGKIKKVPINALTGGGAMSNNPSTYPEKRAFCCIKNATIAEMLPN